MTNIAPKELCNLRILMKIMNTYGPVELSAILRNFLGYTISQMHDQVECKLSDANDLIKSKNIDELNDGMKGCDGHFDSFNLKALIDELATLTSTWTEECEVDVLLKINHTGLKTHMRADEISLGDVFEVEAHKHTRWKRIANPIDDRVLALDCSKKCGDTEIFNSDFIVRPHYGGSNNDFGKIRTPEEIAEEKQKWQDYCDGSNAIEERIGKHIRRLDNSTKILINYSCYEVNDRGVPIDNLDEVAISGKAIIEQLSDYKGLQGYDNYESSVVENPTWLDVCALFNQAIQKTGDFHHSFLEGVCKTKREKDEVAVYSFSIGS